jgi:hypothetical protein
MADALYLSLWYPNFQTASLGPAVLGVLRQFALIGAVPERRSARIHAAAVYPLSWNEAPIYQKIYDESETEDGEPGAPPEQAVPAAFEYLHDDYAYEFELEWLLWTPESELGLDPVWRQEPTRIRVVAFGPQFDDATYEQNGQVRIDLGLDTPFLEEELPFDSEAAAHIRDNVAQLVALATSISQNCGVSSRLLWSESGETLSEKLSSRLQQVQ